MERSSPLEFELFKRINIGVVILDHAADRILFSNKYFKSVAGENEDLIITRIVRHLDTRKPLSVRCDMPIEGDCIIGYTIYKFSASKYLVFVGDISSKKIYFESREESHFYDWLSGLIAELVHEIGNPLASVNTTLQVLFDCLETWDIAKQKSYVMRAINEIERLSKYLKKLREFSASDSYIDKSTVFLKALIDEVFDQHRALVEVKKISVSRAISEDLRVFVDHDVFYQVVLNLVQNSLDILPEGGRIWIEVEDVNDYFVKLVYCNNGPPIPKEMMERIFMPFYSTKTGGSGIGLAVSLKLMTRMGGKMQAEIPKNNEGARFVLYIPIFSEEE